MRIVIISDWFSEKMGYAENCLPKALAALGHEVHLITSDVQPYFNSPEYKLAYEPFIGPPIVPCEVKRIDGYTLHRLPHTACANGFRIRNLLETLRVLRPHIVQTFDVLCRTTLEAALARPFLGYKLFVASHKHASVSPEAAREVKWGLGRWLEWIALRAPRGRLVSWLCEKCYPISSDAADIAVRFAKVQPHKISLCSLGVDTDLFKPSTEESAQQVRTQLRRQFGFMADNIVCIYTGQLSNNKHPLCLARAIHILAQDGLPFRGLFVGNGPQAENIRSCRGCTVYPFVPYRELPSFYWAADIGVWPRQESTSQLDAAACGLPIILSNSVEERERVIGNGLVFQEDNHEDLARRIATLTDRALRAQLGTFGAEKMRKQFSWRHLAELRAQDYETSLNTKDVCTKRSIT